MAAVTPLESRRTAGFDFQTILQTHDLAIGYAGRTPRVIAEQLDLALRPGELVCLIGPNGAGKSTLMRTLAGMQPPLRGQVLLDGANVHRLAARERAQRLSVVLTERGSPGLLTARTLIALGRHPYTDWSGRLTDHDQAVVEDAITAVGAEALADRSVIELSDGERQKVMIARALAQEPAVMILDEPTAFLDLPRRVEIMQLLRRLAHDQRRAILLSTHDLDLALRTTDRIWLMSAGGTLESGAPEDLVLSGAFESVFHAEGATFDPQTGAFRLSGAATTPITVTGDGLPALWTRRALERAGYVITGDAVTGDAHLRVEVTPPCWRLTAAGRASEFRSLADLVEALKVHPPPTPAPM